MFLGRKIESSGIAEVVIALAIIAMCFTVASLVFIRSTSAPMRFQDVKVQTEIQSEILKKMYLNEENPVSTDFEMDLNEDEYSNSLNVLVFKGSDERVLWIQQWWKVGLNGK